MRERVLVAMSGGVLPDGGSVLSTAAFGVPLPVGPSQPVPALHSVVPQVPLVPLVMSKKPVAFL